jgi:phospholipase D1/2
LRQDVSGLAPHRGFERLKLFGRQIVHEVIFDCCNTAPLQFVAVIRLLGSQDVTIRRWDTNQHPLDHPSRIDPTGKPYAPYHDVQAIVDGNAALALAKLVRERWKNGACERAPPIRPVGDPWPAGIVPDLERIDVGIARTYPALEDQDEIRECEALFFDSVERAERAI